MAQFKVFVSSNQKELQDERLAVKETILGDTVLRGIFDIFLFEDMGAKGKAPNSAYLKEVDNSDIYIGILGDKYGIKGKDGFSPTERELRRFLKSKKQKEVLFYIKGKDDSKRDKELQKIIKEVKSNYIYRRFNSTELLKNQVLKSLIEYLHDKGVISKEPFDRRVCIESTYKEIDEREVRNYLKNRAIKLKVSIPKIPIRDFLIKTLNIIREHEGELKPTNTGLLFFGKNPQEYIPQSEVRIARFRGTTRMEFLDSQEMVGPVYKILEQVEIFFMRNTRLANKIVDFKRVDIPEYPFDAVREGIINTMCIQ